MPKDFKKLLKEFVSIGSVSTDPRYRKEIQRAVKWLSSYLSKSGLKVKVIKGYENPIVIGMTPKITGLETVLVYGHYDVQPAFSFNLTEKNGRLYGRGSADNKGQILIHLYSVISLLKENKLKYNVIFMIEGNEETGSTKLRKFVKENKDLIKSDCILVSDGVLGPSNCPVLEASFRGSANFEVVLTTDKEDKHSGLFGGVTPNAAEELGKIIGNLTEIAGKKNGFTPNTKRYEKRNGLERTIEVTGFYSGYVGTGFKNSIPCKAIAKLNARSTPNEDPRIFVKEIKKYILRKAPKYVAIQFIDNAYARGVELNLNNSFAKKTKKTLEEIYERKIFIMKCGALLPIARDFENILRVPQLMVSLANNDCAVHSATENITIRAIKKGLLFSQRFFGR